MINLCLGYKMAHLRTVATEYITLISIGLLSEKLYMMFGVIICVQLQTVYEKWKSQQKINADLNTFSLFTFFWVNFCQLSDTLERCHLRSHIGKTSC